MKKLLSLTIVLSMLIGPLSCSANKVKSKEKTQITYVKINKQELELLKRQALLSRNILQRIRDLEALYKQIKNIVETVSPIINRILKALDIDDFRLPEAKSSDSEFEHISGVIMSPGFVEFSAKVTEANMNFDDLGLSNLELDIYYNKKLFSIDHIEGDGIFGDEFKLISLPQKTSAAKDRIKLPLSDVLANQANFKVYLAPLNHQTIEVGDKTKLDIRYFKRIKKNENGEKIPPITYSFAEGSVEAIEVIVK